MLKKILPILAILSSVIFSPILAQTPTPTNTVTPQVYSVQSYSTNVYSGPESTLVGVLIPTEQIYIQLSNLDPSTTYTFQVVSVSPDDGRTIQQIYGTKQISGVTAYDLSFVGIFPEGLSTPYQVQDNFGNVISKGFTTPRPAIGFFESQETDDNVGIGDVVYNPLRQLVDSSIFVQHDPFHIEDVTTESGDFTLLFYQHPTATCVGGGTTNRITKIKNLESGNTLATIYDDEMLSYNVGGASTFSTTIAQSRRYSACLSGFVVINTSGEIPPFVDITLDQSVYVLSDDPNTLEPDEGVYDYAHLTQDTGELTTYGQSVWVVDSTDQAEWQLSFPGYVLEYTEQNVTVTAFSEGVWNSYDQEVLDDCIQGTIFSGSGGFQTTTIFTYNVGASLIGPVCVSYARYATVMNWYPDSQAFFFGSLSAYGITAREHFDTSINAFIDSQSDGDPTFLRLSLFIGITLMLFAIAGVMHVTIPSVYAVIYAGWTGIFLFWQPLDFWIGFPMAVVAVAALFFAFRGGSENQNV